MNSGNRSTVGVRHSLATHLALRVVPPFFVLGILAIWLFRLSPGAAVLSTLLVLGMGGAFALMLRSQLATELGRLTGAMRQAQQGHLWVRADERGDDEIAELAGSFNAMLAHMTDLRVSQIETQREMASVQNELLLKAELESHKKEIEEANRHLEIRLRELSLLFDITRSINSTLELGELTKLITEMVGVTLGFQEFAMLLLDEETSELRVAATYGFPKQADVDAMRLRLREGAAGRAAQRGEIVLVSDVSQEPDYLPYI